MNRNGTGLLPTHFTDHNGRRVLTDFGSPGLDGGDGTGSKNEMTMAKFASLLFNEGPDLTPQHFDTLQHWIVLSRRR